MRIRAALRAIFLSLFALAAALAVAELASRQYWAGRGLDFFRAPREFSRLLYPELAAPLDRPPKRDIGSFNVLMLGETTLDPGRSTLGEELEVGLERSMGRRVSVVNLARTGNTSLDSFHKAREVAAVPFDLVIVQHGLEDLSANNAPRALFKDDYSHFADYRRINDYQSRRRSLLFPFTLGRAFAAASGALEFSYASPRGRPSPLEAAYGGEIKTEAPLRANLKRVLDLAADAGEPVVLLTTPNDIPPDYSEGRMLEGQLGFAAGSPPGQAPAAIENWGTPAAIATGLARHNAVVADLSGFYSNVIFVDAEAVLPKGRPYFNDFCHLSREGSQLLTGAILRAADRALDFESLIPPSLAGGG